METIKREAFTAADLNWMKKIPQRNESSGIIHPIVVPPVLMIPMEQHLGTPAKPIVDIDDHVYKGQLIAKAKGVVSANIHAPTSGTIIAIAQRSINYDEAKRGTCVVIEADGKDEWIDLEPCRDFQQVSSGELLQKVQDAGVVDIDGEGLPAHISLKPKKEINTIIINACHWNDAVNADDVALLKYAREIVIGLKIIRQMLDQPKRTVVAVEANKDEIANAIFAAIETEGLINCEVSLCDEAKFGPDRQRLIEGITGRELNHDGMPLSIGCVCFNATTVYSIYRAVCLGEPAIAQIVRVSGEGFNRQQTLNVPIGTPMSFVLKQQGYSDNDEFAIRVNNIHTGNFLLREEAPINKQVNSLWAIRKQQSIVRKEHQALNYLDGLDFYDAQEAATPEVEIEVEVEAKEVSLPESNQPLVVEAESQQDYLPKIDALQLDQDIDPPAAEDYRSDDDFDIPLDDIEDDLSVIEDDNIAAHADASNENNELAQLVIENRSLVNHPIEDDISLEMDDDITTPDAFDSSVIPTDREREIENPVVVKAKVDPDMATSKVDNVSLKTNDNNFIKQASANPADLTIRSQNIFRLQNKLKDTEDKLESIDPGDDESAEALLLSINVLIEKINAAKSLREQQNEMQEFDPEANNRTLRAFMGSLQERLALAQGVLSKADRATTSTELAIKQALFQLEARLDNALDEIKTD